MKQGETGMAACAIDVSEKVKWDSYLASAAKNVAPVTDRRVMNNMDAETKIVHLRLEAWARWSKANPELREYPAESWLAKWAKYGTDGASQAGPPVSMPEAIEAVERAVRRLGEIDRKVINAYYLNWAPGRSMHTTVRMREREFMNVLRRARFRVRCYLEATGA